MMQWTVARERLLLQQQQLLLRETNEREQRAMAEALEREKVTLERENFSRGRF